MKNLTIIFCLCLGLGSSCSRLSKNLVQKGRYYLQDGVYKDIEWKESLPMSRISWYQELGLLFDLYFFSYDPESPFSFWFTKDEKKTLAACKYTVIALSFASPDKRLSQADFEAFMEQASYQRISIEGFKRNLSLHPSYKEQKWLRYKLYAFCSKEENPSVQVTFPGFAPTLLESVSPQ